MAAKGDQSVSGKAKKEEAKSAAEIPEILTVSIGYINKYWSDGSDKAKKKTCSNKTERAKAAAEEEEEEEGQIPKPISPNFVKFVSDGNTGNPGNEAKECVAEDKEDAIAKAAAANIPDGPDPANSDSETFKVPPTVSASGDGNDKAKKKKRKKKECAERKLAKKKSRPGKRERAKAEEADAEMRAVAKIFSPNWVKFVSDRVGDTGNPGDTAKKCKAEAKEENRRKRKEAAAAAAEVPRADNAPNIFKTRFRSLRVIATHRYNPLLTTGTALSDDTEEKVEDRAAKNIAALSLTSEPPSQPPIFPVPRKEKWKKPPLPPPPSSLPPLISMFGSPATVPLVSVRKVKGFRMHTLPEAPESSKAKGKPPRWGMDKAAVVTTMPKREPPFACRSETWSAEKERRHWEYLDRKMMKEEETMVVEEMRKSKEIAEKKRKRLLEYLERKRIEEEEKQKRLLANLERKRIEEEEKQKQKEEEEEMKAQEEEKKKIAEKKEMKREAAMKKSMERSQKRKTKGNPK